MMKLFIQVNNRRVISYICLVALVTVFAFAGCSEPAPAPVAPQEPAVTSPKLGVNSLIMDLRFVEGDSKTVTKNITFMNEGEGVMVWAVRKSVPWVWMNEPDGVLEKGYSKNLEIFIAPAGKAPGTYTDNITIEGAGARNSPQTVVLTMVITPAPPAAGSDAAAAAAKKPVPAPPWDYNEYNDGNYNFRLRYPKDYQKKQLAGSTFGAEASGNSSQANSIRVTIINGLGVDFNTVTLEWAKAIRMSGGGSSPKVVSSDNATTLLDGVTPAFEFLYEAKATMAKSSQVYIYGVKKGNKYIMFGAVAPLDMKPDRLQLWKEIARTLEFVDKN